MKIQNIPAPQRRELVTWITSRTSEAMQDPEIRQEFEIWKAERAKKMAPQEAVPER